MANNRLWLVNELTSKRTLLAKYYPSEGWSLFSLGYNGNFEGVPLNELLELDHGKYIRSYNLYIEFDHELE